MLDADPDAIIPRVLLPHAALECEDDIVVPKFVTFPVVDIFTYSISDLLAEGAYPPEKTHRVDDELVETKAFAIYKSPKS